MLQIPGLWAFIRFQRVTTRKTIRSTCSSERMPWMESTLGRPHTPASDSSAKYDTHANTNTQTHKLASHKRTHTKGERQWHTDAFTPTLCQIAAVSGKTLDRCLSGFYNGSFQGLLSGIIFSLEKSGLCCARCNHPQRQKPERNVKCHWNLRGKEPVNGSTVILMSSFGTDWVLSTLQLLGMFVKSLDLYQVLCCESHSYPLSRKTPNWLQICRVNLSPSIYVAAYRAFFIKAWLTRMPGICRPHHKTNHPLCKMWY